MSFWFWKVLFLIAPKKTIWERWTFKQMVTSLGRSDRSTLWEIVKESRTNPSFSLFTLRHLAEISDGFVELLFVWQAAPKESPFSHQILRKLTATAPNLDAVSILHSKVESDSESEKIILAREQEIRTASYGRTPKRPILI